MTLFTRQTAQGRCPCGAQHAACGPPSGAVPVDSTIEEVVAVGGPLQKYRYTNAAGHETVLKLNAADAERYGLGEDDLVGSPAPEAKARGAQNKARTASDNKAGGGGRRKAPSPGDGGPGDD